MKARLWNSKILHDVPWGAGRFSPVLLERYGTERGFGHTLGDIAGLVVVGVPIDGAVGKIREATIGYAALYGGGMLLFFALVQMFFNRLIMTNLHRLTDKFRKLFQEDEELGFMEKLENVDEIEEVVQGLEELGDHVHEMNYQLRQHSRISSRWSRSVR